MLLFTNSKVGSRGENHDSQWCSTMNIKISQSRLLSVQLFRLDLATAMICFSLAANTEGECPCLHADCRENLGTHIPEFRTVCPNPNCLYSWPTCLDWQHNDIHDLDDWQCNESHVLDEV